METFAFSRVFVAVILLTGMCMVMVPHADAQRRCQEMLEPHGCELYDCQKACYWKHKAQQPRGECLSDPSFNYSCVCFYNC